MTVSCGGEFLGGKVGTHCMKCGEKIKSFEKGHFITLCEDCNEKELAKQKSPFTSAEIAVDQAWEKNK